MTTATETSILDSPVISIPGEREDLARGFLRIKEYLLKSGWRQRSYWDGKGRACLLGATRLTNGGNIAECHSPFRKTRLEDVLVDRLTMQIRQETCDPGMEIYLWNDNPFRTFEEVIALLDRAILANS